ncbi:MAG: hypothetical protein LQ338_005029 [Usnochroma carphineum]|nr:MAG: hypothetical protein LQ338_005029 [Usnochroma carphineum]
MPFRREDTRTLALRIKAEMEEEERRKPRQTYGTELARHMEGLKLDAPKGYEAYPEYKASAHYEQGYQAYPEYKAPAQYESRPKPEKQPKYEAPRGRPNNNKVADNARALAAQRGRPDRGVQPPGAGLFGPTVRDGTVKWDPDHPPFREIQGTRYKLVRNIGVGGQGHCDLYEHPSNGEYLVCKIMKRHSADFEGGKPKEAVILMDILDPHRRIIDLHAYGSTSSYTTFWYEYCAGGDLQDIMDGYIRRRDKIPESFIWHVYMQLADAFAYIHTGYDRLNDGKGPPKNFQPIVHRDVKPPNIFLKPNGSDYPNLVLADFGLATRRTRSCETDLMGTPVWQPPELPVHTPQGDIWSLGACIHAMATGSPPLKSTPRGFRGDWVEEPKARMVADLKKFGYSKHLDDAMYAAMRTRASERLIGKQLVDRVRKGYSDWGCKEKTLVRWF